MFAKSSSGRQGEGLQRASVATNTDTSVIGANLREARERAGLTRAQLAALAGCSLASLGNIEQGAVSRESRVLAAALEAIDRYVERNAKRATQPPAVVVDPGTFDPVAAAKERA